MIEKISNKSAVALKSLSNYFIQVNEGDRIQTITDFLEWIPVSRGTVQNSLQILKDMRAVDIESRGKLGSYLVQKNIDVLLKFSNISFLVGAMPLPYSTLYEGLASGILEGLENSLNIPISLANMRGSKHRISLVREGRYDFAITSFFAAKEYLKSHPFSIEIAINFGPETFVKEHVLLKRKDYDRDGVLRVGIDPLSLDQSTLTKMYFQHDEVEYVVLNYYQICKLLDSGDIDMAIWNGDEIEVDSNKIQISSLADRLELLRDNTEAVIVVDKERPEILHLVRDALDVTEVLRIQEEVRQGKKTPRY